MSDTKVKISQLPAVSEVLGTDESPSVQSSTTKKFSMTQLGTYILSSFSGLSLGGITQTAKSAIDALSNFIGNTSMGTTATTVTGAIAEHEGDIISLNSSLSIMTAKAGSALAAQQSLSTSPTVVRCTSQLYNTGDIFTLVSDGGFRSSRAGRVKVSGFMHVTGVTSGDEIALAIGVYSGGSWAYESYSMRSKTITVAVEFSVGVGANQIAYIRASNNSGSRGTIDSAQLNIEWLSD